MFFMFLMFLCFFNVVFLLLLKTKNIQNYKYDAFFMGKKTPSPEQSECFVAVLFTLICNDGVSYLNGYCSLMFLCMFFNVFYKSEKHGGDGVWKGDGFGEEDGLGTEMGLGMEMGWRRNGLGREMIR